MVTVNGKPEEIAGMRLFDYLTQAGYDPTRIAVEKNGEIVPKSQYDSVILLDSDTVEIVRFVGGG